MVKKAKRRYEKVIIYILTSFFCVFPWVTYVKLMEYNEEEMALFSSYKGLSLDFFLYYKEILLLAMAVFFISWFIGERIFPDKVDNEVPLLKGNNKALFILLGLFLGGAFISTLFSEYQKTAWWGSPNEGEGLFTLVGYTVLILVFYNYFAKEQPLMLIKKAFLLLSIVTIALTMLEYFYKPLMEIGLIQKLISPAGYEEVMASTSASNFKNMVALTFNNPGYYGAFVILLLPFVLTGFFNAKKRLEQVIYVLLITGLMFCVIVSNSTAALYVSIAELVMVALLQMLSLDKFMSFLKLIIVLCAIGVSVLFYSVVSGSSIWDIVTNANSATVNVAEDRFEITDIKLQEKAICIHGEDVGFQVTFHENEIRVLDLDGNRLNAEYIDGKLKFTDQAYQNVSVGIIINSDIGSEVLAKIMIDAGYQDTIDFFLLEDGTMSGIGQNNAVIKDVDGVDIPKGLEKYYGVFTGRGYAWVNSLPLLKHTLIKGVGPGNFGYYFKQQDYLGMLQTHESTKYIIDRPHNMYLQYSINLGVPSMLGFFGVLVYTVVNAFTQFKKRKKETTVTDFILVGGMVSIVGFSISALMNDSIVTYTPVLCMIMGIVLGASYMLKRNKE